MMNKAFVLVVVFTLLACSENVMGEERRGAEIVVTKCDGQQITGELVAVKPSSLLLLDSQAGADVSVEIAEIGVIKIIKKSKFLDGAWFGLIIGAAIGAPFGKWFEATGDFPYELEKRAGDISYLGFFRNFGSGDRRNSWCDHRQR